MISIVANFSDRFEGQNHTHIATPLIRCSMSCAGSYHLSSLALLSSSISTANLSRLVAASFSSLRLLSHSDCRHLISSGQVLFLVVLIFASYPQPFFPLSSSVAETLFGLSFPFLSERSFFVVLKLLKCVVEGCV